MILLLAVIVVNISQDSHIYKVLFRLSPRNSAPCILNNFSVPILCIGLIAHVVQSGQPLFVLYALLLLTLPLVFTFHALLALLRLAERNHTLTEEDIAYILFIKSDIFVSVFITIIPPFEGIPRTNGQIAPVFHLFV